jgi:hypothetical protein
MKISVAYDKQGKILGAIATDPRSSIQPHIEMDNASVENLDVPAEFDGKGLHEFLHHFHVDVAARRLVRVREK